MLHAGATFRHGRCPLTVQHRCRIKDNVADKRQRVLPMDDEDRIQFADEDVMVFGKYVCRRAYACEKSWNK
jgi:hypothetical protein